MPPEGSRRRKSPALFDIVVIPVGQGESTKSLRTSRTKIMLSGAAAILLCLGVAYIVLVYTPLADVVPIPSPALERRYGQQIVTLQEQLNGLVHDVMLLKDYNVQLRKALGEGSTGDSTIMDGGPSLMADEGLMHQHDDSPQESPPVAAASPGTDDRAAAMEEGRGGAEPGGLPGAYGTVVTAADGGRASFPLMLPVEGMVSQGFDPVRGHYGIDVAGKRGTPVFAAAEGHVVFSGWTFDDGNMVILAHDGGYMTVYKHNQALLAGVQAVVRRGEAVALLGDSGVTSTGPHLHFEVWRNGIPRDPNEYLLAPANVQ